MLGSAMRLAVVAAAARVAVTQLILLKFYVVLAAFQPVTFLTIAGLLSDSGPYLRDAVLSAGLMGMWSTTLFGAGGALDRERRYGTLELLFAAPTQLVGPILGACLGAAALGLVSIVLALGVGWLAFDVHTPLVRLPGIAVASVVAVLGLAAFGLVIAGVFVLARQTRMLVNLLEYPVWVCSGLLVPSEALPDALRLVGLALPTTWALQLLRATADGSLPAALRAGAVLVLLTVAFVALGVLLLGRMERAARDRGDLSFV